MYRVDLDILLPEGLDELSDPDEIFKRAPFLVTTRYNGGGKLSLRCEGIRSAGSAQFPEALRLAQTGLSSLLRYNVPEFEAVGGLLWKFVIRAEVAAIADEE
jgi:hypothetical protein